MVVVAQLAERLVVVQEVAGSTPPSITPMERVVMVIRNGPFVYPRSGSPAHGVPEQSFTPTL